MAETSEISWTDSTYNPWIGCTKVGPGCDHCYAEADFDLRKGIAKWGDGEPRHRTKTWPQVLKWEREHADFFLKHGRKRRVFAASLADIFDNQVEEEWRKDFWGLVRATPHLEWLIVTKRISNVRRMLPADWCDYPARYSHVVLIVTVCNQPEIDRDGVRLLSIKRDFRWLRVGLSIEPLLGPMIFRWSIWDAPFTFDWVIVGGESGPEARPMHPEWLRAIHDECRTGEIPFHFKQWGEWAPALSEPGIKMSKEKPNTESIRLCVDGSIYNGDGRAFVTMLKVGKRESGRKLFNKTYNGFPAFVP